MNMIIDGMYVIGLRGYKMREIGKIVVVIWKFFE